jgi:formylglycine-generating enzyme
MSADTYKFTPIPGKTCEIGNVVGDDDITDNPIRSVTLSPYCMAVNDTTKAEWDTVRTWGTTHGYTDLAVGGGKAANHPVVFVSWYDVVKWANAASEMDGLKSCYQVSGEVYRMGKSDEVTCDWAANGYRLPTEAEWEVAARGGLKGTRFPWSVPTISHDKANYTASGDDIYDLSAGADAHPAYEKGQPPYTSPVGSFAPNWYGLYDMAANVFQWCWDWYGGTVDGSDPKGVSQALHRVLRGGYWSISANVARVAFRNSSNPATTGNYIGFRMARARP